MTEPKILWSRNSRQAAYQQAEKASTVYFNGKDLHPRDDLELEILRDAESSRRNEEKARERRMNLLRELRVLAICSSILLTLAFLISLFFDPC